MAKTTQIQNTTTAPAIMTFAAMEQMLTDYRELKAQEPVANDKQIEFLKKGMDLIQDLNDAPVVDWDAISTIEQLNDAREIVAKRKEIFIAIEEHFTTIIREFAPAPKVKKTTSDDMKKYKKLMKEEKGKLKLQHSLTDSAEDRKKLKGLLVTRLKELNVTKPAA